MVVPSIVTVLLAPVACTCGPTVTPFVPSDQCGAAAGSGALPDTRTVALGAFTEPPYNVDGGSYENLFVPYADGETQEIIAGFQGGYMVTPVVEVSTGDATAPSACLSVDFKNSLEGGGKVAEGFVVNIQFDRAGDHYYSQPVYDFLGDDRGPFEGRTLVMDVAVSGTDFRSSTTLRLHLR